MAKFVEIRFESRDNFKELMGLFSKINLLRVQSMTKMGSSTCMFQLKELFKLKDSEIKWATEEKDLSSKAYESFLKSKKKVLFVDINVALSTPYIDLNQLIICGKKIIYTNDSIDVEPQSIYVLDEVSYEEFIFLMSKYCDQYNDIAWLDIKKLYELSGAHTSIVCSIINDLQITTVKNTLSNPKFRKLKKEMTQYSLEKLSDPAVEVLKYLSYWYKDNLDNIYEFFKNKADFNLIFKELVDNSLIIKSNDNMFYVPQIIQQSIRQDTNVETFHLIKTDFLKQKDLFCRSFVLFHSYPESECSLLNLVDYRGSKRSLFLSLIEDEVKLRRQAGLLSDSEKLAYSIYQFESGVLQLAKDLALEIVEDQYLLRAKLVLFKINSLLNKDEHKQKSVLLDLYKNKSQLSQSDLATLYNSLSSHYNLINESIPFNSKIEVLETAKDYCIEKGLNDALYIILINLNLGYRYANSPTKELEIQTEILGTIVEFNSPNETKLAYRKIELFIELEHYHEADQLLEILLAKSQEARDLNLLSHYYLYSGMICLLQDDHNAIKLLSLAEASFAQIGDQYRKLLCSSISILACICHRNLKDSFRRNQLFYKDTKKKGFGNLVTTSKLYQVILLFMQDMKTDALMLKALHETHEPFIGLIQTVENQNIKELMEVPEFNFDAHKNLLLQKLDKYLFDSLKSEFRFVCFNNGSISRVSQYRSDLYFNYQSKYDVYIDLVQNRFYEKTLSEINIGRKRSLLNLFVVLCVSQAKLSNSDIFQILWQKKYNHETDEPVIRMNINRLKKVIEPIEDIYIQKDLIHGTYFINPAFKVLIVLHESDWISIQEAINALEKTNLMI